jgi:hypothetical protein
VAQTRLSSRRALVASAALFLVVGTAGPALAMTSPRGDAGADDNKQRICHATNADGNQYVENEPAKSGDLAGHAGHTGPLWGPGIKDAHISWGDIIPPFDYTSGEDVLHFPGLNWPAGQATWDNGCDFVPPALSLTVVKTNDADADDEFSDDETAADAGSDVTFQVVVTNTGDAPVALDSVVDKVGADVIAFDCVDSEGDSLVGQTLAVGASATCTATVADYSPAAGGTTTNTVTVSGHQDGDCVLEKKSETPCSLQEDPDNKVSASDTSVVNTAVEPSPTPSVTPTETVSPTPSPSESTGGGGTVEPGESPSPTTSPSRFTGGGGVVTLPFTGLPVALLSATAAGMLALGLWVFFLGRRRTTR